MDRLSALPDELIFHILSFLPDPKMLLQTSVLAKAWRFHWSRVPGFGFTKMIPNTKNHNQTKGWSLLPFFRFTNHVEVLSQNSNTCCFHIGPATSNHEFESWIATVFARNVRYLVITLNHQLTLPPCFFMCETLLYLHIIDAADILHEDATVYFPALKKLQLVNVDYHSDYSLSSLLEGCPVLEELIIERMNKENSCIVSSDAPTLTSLVIDIENSNLVCLGIPSLKYLRLRAHGSVMYSIHALPLPNLIEADIDLMNIKPEFDFSWTLIVFVREMYNVKCLTLSTRLLEVPTPYFLCELVGVKFHNLTKLSLRTDWRFITRFLENANNLRDLTIFRMGTQYWVEPRQVPACLVSRLETVNLVDFEWCGEHEFRMLKYIMRNAKVLKKMEIISTPQCQLDWNVKFEAIKRFAMLEIGSRTCELILNMDAEI